MQADLILADFGCARALKRTAHGAWGSLPDDDGGTLAFTPPEAFEERVQGAHTDVWSAGCAGFSLLFLRPNPNPNPNPDPHPNPNPKVRRLLAALPAP